MKPIHQKRDGSSVRQRLQESAKAHRQERHQKFMDAKLGRNRQQDQVSLSGTNSEPVNDIWAQAAKTLGMTAQSDGQGGVIFSDAQQEMSVKRDADGVLRWDFPTPSSTPPQDGDLQLVKDQDGVSRWILPGETAPPSSAPPSDMWKQVGEQLGMSVEDNGQGGFIFRDK